MRKFRGKCASAPFAAHDWASKWTNGVRGEGCNPAVRRAAAIYAGMSAVEAMQALLLDTSVPTAAEVHLDSNEMQVSAAHICTRMIAETCIVCRLTQDLVAPV